VSASERVRGNRLQLGHPLVRQRSIPARAGEPLLWQARISDPLGCLDPWSIPACAGEPVLQRPQEVAYQVDPRVCGGTRTGRARRARR